MTQPQDINPLTLSVVRHKLQAIAEEMAETMTHTCFSPILNQNQDFSTVIADADGSTIAQAERVPIHMGAMSWALKEMLRRFGDDLRPGDIVIANDPFAGGSHLPDITMSKPVFCDGKLCLWVSIRAHQGDIGGISAGGYSPAAREIWHEGLRISPVRLVRRDEVQHDILDFIALNSRKPGDLKGDILAQIAAVNIGAQRLASLLAHYGADEIGRCVTGILDAGERGLRAMLQRCTQGVFEGMSYLENEGGEGWLPLPVTVEIRDGQASVDLTRCPDQVTNFLNSPIANTRAAVNVAFLYLCDDEQQLNDGSARAITLHTRKGSLVDPVEPAPVAACTSLTASAIIEAVLQAMALSLPGNVLAGFARRFRFAIASQDAGGDAFIWHSFYNRGGAGANAHYDGWPNLGGIHNPGGTPSPGIERTEATYPLRIEEYSLRQDSCGAGEQRGGLGGKIVIHYLGNQRGVVNVAGAGTDVLPYGLMDGHAAAGHVCVIERAGGERLTLSGRESGIAIDSGDRLVCLSAGGGGYGNPAKRAPWRIEADIANGYISPAHALANYGYGDKQDAPPA
ncbi:Putative 5-oxoprolinase (ATP-hydrolyzing) [Sodalis praecaptivus]|uniref:Putative 5-oxoprolinase (ATP-hydrolyzing) n=1 Tax=Sodalis praecaptivus TaxID=1239307 RepID=W0HWS1_9GAMM|nr:hydantoinase B/oxoprolinase family protein [Sodalis praecaptivus]AHF76598.1 Putative 5-oxoprolinase (ATP-hydrolyzing) [Sodalis praecaptivus]